jgi:hypothetical protein
MDVLALILAVAAMVMFVFAASGRELRRFNEIAVGLVLLTAALICQFTSITNTHIGRLALRARQSAAGWISGNGAGYRSRRRPFGHNASRIVRYGPAIREIGMPAAGCAGRSCW